MTLFAKIIILAVAALHTYFLYFEMFAWDTIGRKLFGKAMPPEVFPHTKGLAANQGLYNGFLAAGLLWSVFIADPTWQRNVASYFLICVAVAGLYGAATASKRILYVQALPALVGLLVLWLVN
jgi:putative membrane protein